MSLAQPLDLSPEYITTSNQNVELIISFFREPRDEARTAHGLRVGFLDHVPEQV